MARLITACAPVAGEAMIGSSPTPGPGGLSAPEDRIFSLPAGDEAYARALSRGDPAAAREFMRRNLPVILGIARRLLADETEAEDAAQDVFVKVWKKAHHWQPGRARFDSWVGRIAIHACYDRLRKRRERPVDTLPERPGGPADAEARIDAEQTGARVRAAIARLPGRQTLALELCHFQGHSNIEAAAMMEISIEALESLLARARRTLKAELAGEAKALLDSFAAARGEEG